VVRLAIFKVQAVRLFVASVLNHSQALFAFLPALPVWSLNEVPVTLIHGVYSKRAEESYLEW
jgi:hypothetical protein